MPVYNFKYALPDRTPDVVTPTGEQAAWPATNALLNTAPRRPWRTLVKTSIQDLVLDFTSTVTIQALLISWTNYPSVLVQGSADNSSYTTITPTGYATSADGLAIPQDPDMTDLRRRLMVDMTGLFSYRYLRLRISANLTTDDDAAYYSTGAITMASSLQTMAGRYAGGITLTLTDAETVNEFPGGGAEVNQLGAPKASFEWGGLYEHSSAASQVREIDRWGSRPFILYPCFREGGVSGDTEPDGSRGYLVRRVGQGGRAYSDIPEVFSKQYSFTEVV